MRLTLDSNDVKTFFHLEVALSICLVVLNPIPARARARLHHPALTMKRLHTDIRYQGPSTSLAQIKVSSHEEIRQGEKHYPRSEILLQGIERSSNKESFYVLKQLSSCRHSTSVCNYDLLESFVHPGTFHWWDSDYLSIKKSHRKGHILRPAMLNHSRL